MTDTGVTVRERPILFSGPMARRKGSMPFVIYLKKLVKP